MLSVVDSVMEIWNFSPIHVIKFICQEGNQEIKLKWPYSGLNFAVFTLVVPNIDGSILLKQKFLGFHWKFC